MDITMELSPRSRRYLAITESIREDLVKHRKTSIQMFLGSIKVDGENCRIIKFSTIDSPRKWEYMNNLLERYCETLLEYRRTATTLIVIM